VPEQQDPVGRPRFWKAIIGQDLLHEHRLWISFAGWQVFLSEPKAAK
jgi:hypothetical protein